MAKYIFTVEIETDDIIGAKEQIAFFIRKDRQGFVSSN